MHREIQGNQSIRKFRSHSRSDGRSRSGGDGRGRSGSNGGKKGKGLDIVQDINMSSHTSYKEFNDNIGHVWKVHPDFMELAYKFSSSPKSEPAASLDSPETLAQLFKFTHPLVTKKSRSSKPFKVFIFDISSDVDKSDSDRMSEKGKRVSYVLNTL